MSEAREYGISFVLEPPGSTGPQGAVFVGNIGPESLCRVPGAATAVLVADSGEPGVWPPIRAAGTPVSVTHSDPAAWAMTTRVAEPSVLRLHLTNVPGWHASIDGRPVRLQPFARTMLQVRLPSGTHAVRVWYWPRAFTAGLVVALCAILALAVAIIGSRMAAQRTRRSDSGLDNAAA